MYKVVRMFFNDDVPDTTIARGLTLEEAQAHCRDPETSSSTCAESKGVALTKRYGPWFDGYSET